MSPIPKIFLQRTLHPVGQGGFYTEQIFVRYPQFKDSKLYTIVYDCGSQNKGTIDEEIQRTFPKDSLIDALFISHFDNDHINGLPELRRRGVKVRYLILPLLTNTQKILAFLSIGIKKFDADSIKQYLDIDAETVMFIESPYSLENEYQDYIPHINLGITDGIIGAEVTLFSGVSLMIEPSIKWIYKPFNICDDSLYEELLKNLDSEKQLKEKLARISKEPRIMDIEDKFGIQDQNKLRDIYNKITSRRKNKSSMVVYSGPIEIQKRKFSQFNPIPTNEWIHSFLCSANKVQLRKAVGAIYTGDLDLNAKIFNSSSSVCDYLRHALDAFSEIIGTIQVPHHGSRHNFNPSIIQNFPNAYIYFCSYGLNNTYHHPYAGIRITIMSKKRILWEITEEDDSKFIQLIEIKNDIEK